MGGWVGVDTEINAKPAQAEAGVGAGAELGNTSLAAPGALAHRLQRRTACNTSPPTISKMADGVRE